MIPNQAAAILIVALGIINADALEWSTWGACSVTCGRGIQIRKCIPTESCPHMESRSCRRISRFCNSFLQLFQRDPCNVWSECSASCGGGKKTMTKCGRGEKVVTSCNNIPCPSDISETGDACPTNGVPSKYRPAENVCCTPAFGSQCGRINNSRKKSAASAVFVWDDTQQLFPWSVVVKVGSARCGGVMISHNYVLTAASCVSLVKRPSSISVLRGAANKWYGNYAGDRRTVKAVIKHPDFIRQIKYDNNLAILELNEAFTDQPVCMPRGEEIPEGSTCVVADFEKAFHNSHYLKHVSNDFTIASFATCEEHYQRFNFQYLNANELLNEDKMVCGWRSSTSLNQPRTCRGTAGAPLLCQRCASCQWMLQGIVSYSDDSCYPTYRPAIFTRLSMYEEWISNTVDLGYVDEAPTC